MIIRLLSSLLMVLSATFSLSAQSASPVVEEVSESIIINEMTPSDSVPAANITPTEATPTTTTAKVYTFPIREDIMPSAVRLTTKCLDEALAMDVDYVVIDMNTYGGLLNAADSIRTRILNFPKPVYMFINNQAASAGALISIAADRIYMRDGASIGAATVVNQDGGQAPDKYQSFMRGMMRSTAEAHGMVVDKIIGSDTTWRWFRDPSIAEGMVDATIIVAGVSEAGKVITFSTEEAIKYNYCEGKASSVEQIMALAGVEDYEITEYRPTSMDRLLGFMTNPAFQGFMIMLIIGGIYFELKTPGLGLPAIVAVLAAMLYFAPLYLEGVLAYWEIILFVIGIILIIVEIFVTPGFGIIGIAGIVAVITGLTFAMIDTGLLRHITTGELSIGFVLRPLGLVIIAITGAMILSIMLARKLLITDSIIKRKLVLESSMSSEDGYISRAADRGLKGHRGVAATAMRPTGRVEIEGVLYESAGENGLFIERGEPIVVVRDESGILFCRSLQ